jgi:hypothetical protein
MAFALIGLRTRVPDQSSELDSLPLQASVAPPPHGSCREPHSLAGEGRGCGTQFKRMDINSGTLYILYNHFVFMVLRVRKGLFGGAYRNNESISKLHKKG